MARVRGVIWRRIASGEMLGDLTNDRVRLLRHFGGGQRCQECEVVSRRGGGESVRNPVVVQILGLQGGGDLLADFRTRRRIDQGQERRQPNVRVRVGQ